MPRFVEVVPKVWGREEWIVNCDEYCGKLIHLKAGASGSLHYHKEKKETFFLLSGMALIMIGGDDFALEDETMAVTILPNVPHSMTGVSDAVLLEISTHHDDDDTYRLEESRDTN